MPGAESERKLDIANLPVPERRALGFYTLDELKLLLAEGWHVRRHDLRSPVTVLNASADLFMSVDKPETRERRLRAMKQSVQQLVKTLNSQAESDPEFIESLIANVDKLWAAQVPEDPKVYTRDDMKLLMRGVLGRAGNEDVKRYTAAHGWIQLVLQDPTLSPETRQKAESALAELNKGQVLIRTLIDLGVDPDTIIAEERKEEQFNNLAFQRRQRPQLQKTPQA